MANRAAKRSQDITLDEWASEVERLCGPKKEFDEKAKTVEELMPLFGIQWSSMNELAKRCVAEGKWERVFKRDRLGRPMAAYRIKK